jgi:histone acetyltransferase (RNA polymerase elongator complex component)
MQLADNELSGNILINEVEKFAKEEGCKMMELIARPGWKRVYNNYGYKRTHVVLEKQIKQENKE